jgi:hypothetical protein
VLASRVTFVLAFGLVACGAASQHGGDAGPLPDAADGPPDTPEESAPDRGPETIVDAPGDPIGDRTADVSERCIAGAPLVVSDPMVTAGTPAAGQTVTLQLTLSDTDPPGTRVSYPEILLSTSTAGVTVRNGEVGPVGSIINGGESRPVAFTVSFDATVVPGSQAVFSARAIQAGGAACPNAFELIFPITVQ